MGEEKSVFCYLLVKMKLIMVRCRNVFKKDEIGVEIAQIAIPAAMALAADPIASLVDTAFIGHLGLFPLFLAFFDQ